MVKIAIDIDGVLADFNGHWVRTYEHWFGVKLDPEAANSWTAFLDHTHFGGEDEFWRWTDAVPGFWENMPLLPGAAGGAYRLLAHGHQVELVTNRHDRVRAATDAWARRHLPKHWRPVIHFVKGDKSVVPAQLYVDDRPSILEGLRSKGLRAIRFEQPWNADVKGDADWKARDWAGVLKIVARESGVLVGQRTVFDLLGTDPVGVAS